MSEDSLMSCHHYECERPAEVDTFWSCGHIWSYCRAHGKHKDWIGSICENSDHAYDGEYVGIIE
jgi:hypothetical protein